MARRAAGARVEITGGHLIEGSRTRPRCTQCGNLTRFDVVETRRTRAFHHLTLAGELTVEDEKVLSVERERITCRWCGSSEIEEVEAP